LTRYRGPSRKRSWPFGVECMASYGVRMSKTLLLFVLLAGVAAAQSDSLPPPVTTNSHPESSNASHFRMAPGIFIWAEFSKPLDARKNRAGDPVEAKTSVDLLAQGKVVLPRNTKVLGHVTAVKPRTKDSPASYIAITLDRLVLEDGQELPVRLVVQAMAGPLRSLFNGKDSTDEPSTILPPVGTSGVRATSMGNPALGQIPGRQYPAREQGHSETVLMSTPGSNRRAFSVLGTASQGAVGLGDICLTSVDRIATISSSTQNLHVYSLSQLLLKTQ
jgi:hypothetical protein